MTASPFVFPIRVYYEDTDASGVAYHANYLRWFERGRTEWLRSLGFSQELLREELAVAFTVANLQIDYRRPARLDDLLEVATRVAEVRAASLVFEQVLGPAGGGQLLARASVRVGCVDMADFRPTALPGGLKAAFGKWVEAPSRSDS
jgi:acyl-CoA thioester hydrolase